MRIISYAFGFVLSFNSLRELKGVIRHLSGMVEWIEKEKIKPPHLYSIVADKAVSKREWKKILRYIKETL